jgi:hypothetical protein
MLNTVSNESGIYICSCGAKAEKKGEFKRFLQRHPTICSTQQKDLAYTKQVAQGTESVVGRKERKAQEYSDEHCTYWLAEINKHGIGLTEWETDFIKSVNIRLEKNGIGCLTPNMRRILGKIYGERVPED